MMTEPRDIRRVLQEAATAPDVRQWFREHTMEREKLLVLLHRAREPEEQRRLRRAERQNRMYTEDQQPVGPLLPPPGTYTFVEATLPIESPDHEPLAQLAHIPPSLTTFIGAAFPPFGRSRRIPSDLSPPEERISFRTIGLVQYRGDEGEVVIQTSRPSAAALKKELILGNPTGELPDGTPVASGWGNALRWRWDDLIIDVIDTTNRMSHEKLGRLAADVVLM